MTSNNTLTSVLVGGLKWSGKSSFMFFVLSALIIGGSISYADPEVNYYTIDGGTTNLLVEKYLDEDNTQFGIDVDYGSEVTLNVFRVTYLTINAENQTYSSDTKSSGAVEELEEVFTITASDFYRDISLQPGTYRFLISSDTDTGFMFGLAEFNMGAVAIAVVFVILFSITISIFFTILPFAFFILILNALSGGPKTKHVYVTETKRSAPASKPSPARSAKATRRDARRDARVHLTVPFAAPFVLPKFTDKFTNQDWTGLAFALFFFIMFFVEPNGPFFVFFVLIIIGTLYNVQERERMKTRIITLLTHYPETNVDFLKMQLGKKKTRDVLKVLQLMILDDGQPIQLNLNNNTVRVVGELIQDETPVAPVAPVSTPSPAAAPVAPQPVVQTPVEPVAPAPVEEVPAKKTNAENYCTGCGEILVQKVKYCYACGQKSD